MHAKTLNFGVSTALFAAMSVGLSGASRAEEAAPAAEATRLPTLWIIGDSTVKNGTRGQQGWGDPIADYFDSARIRVMNRARGGRSSRTYLTEGLWQEVLDQMQPGDWV